MTNEMPAGRELDALVTSAFFEPKPEAKTYRQLDAEDADNSESEGCDCWRVVSPKGHWHIDIDMRRICREGLLDEPAEWVPSFERSKKIAPAWEVVEALKRDGWTVTICTRHYDSESYSVEIERGTRNCAYVTSVADTVSEAICRGALAVAGQELAEVEKNGS